jgi:energy-converting hydrogenase Eha subunit F
MPLLLAKAPMWLIVFSIFVAVLFVVVIIVGILLTSGWNPKFLLSRPKAPKLRKQSGEGASPAGRGEKE